MTCLDKDSSSVPKMDNRRLDVDALKALGALLVVAYHCGVVSLVGAAADSYPLLYLRSFFAICVPAFFLATGLLYSGRDFPVGKGLRKAAKLFALTLIWGGGYVDYRRRGEGTCGLTGDLDLGRSYAATGGRQPSLVPPRAGDRMPAAPVLLVSAAP